MVVSSDDGRKAHLSDIGGQMLVCLAAGLPGLNGSGRAGRLI
jgi:hypothetical protein